MENLSVIGIGRLGLCTALVFEKAGYNVLGVDIVKSYVEDLNNKNFESYEPNINEYLKQSKHFRATTSLVDALQHSDIIFILVATPTGIGEKSYDHTHLSKILFQINEKRVKNKNIVIGSTVLPGYIANVGRYLLKDCEDCTLNYNPEFIAQGNIINDFANPDIVLIGEQNSIIGDRLQEIYTKITKNKPYFARMSPESAEITKLSINCFITTKIAFANMIGDISFRTPNADSEQILAAVGHDSRIGTKCLKPGFGFGGPCFPRDNRALGNYAKSVGIDPVIPEGTDRSNQQHAIILANNVIESCVGTSKTFTFEDVAYKPNCPVPIIEESHPLLVAKLAHKGGINVTIKDRKIIIDKVKQEFGNMFSYEIINEK